LFTNNKKQFIYCKYANSDIFKFTIKKSRQIYLLQIKKYDLIFGYYK